MLVKLKDIVALQPGVHIKTSEDPISEKVHILGLKDFDNELRFLGNPAEVNIQEVKDKYIVQKNHILFSSRLKFNAFSLPKDSPKTFVASSSFIILKPHLDKVIPEYLIWYLNLPQTQAEFNYLSQASGRLPYINRKKLAETEIELPELSIQKEITHIVKLQKREKQLLQNLIQKKEQYIQSLLLKRATYE